MPHDNDYPTTVGDLLESSRVYVMPLYQRTYCWGTDKPNVELDLYKSDLSELFENITSEEKKEVFLGAIILSDSINQTRKQRGVVGRSETFYEVIDGQQRLTTLYLTYAALALHAKQRDWTELYQDLVDTRLSRRKSREMRLPSLEPTSEDGKQFNVILDKFDGDIQLLPNALGPDFGKLTEAFDFIRVNVVEELIKPFDPSLSDKDSFGSFLDGLDSGFVVADVVVNKSHDANEVFTRLNTAGQRLSRVDRIRNLIFQKIRRERDASQKETHFHRREWVPFEESLKHTLRPNQKTQAKHNQADAFFLPYARNLQQRVSERNLHDVLEKSWKEKGASEVIADMNEYVSPYFVWVHDEVTDDNKLPTKFYQDRIPDNYSPSLKDAICRMHQLRPNNSVAFPFLMRCLREIDMKRLDEKEFVTSLRIMESFFVRRAYVTGEEGTGYHAIFQRLWFDTNGNPEKLLNKMPTSTKQFPNDDEFKRAIKEQPLYGKKHLPKFCMGEYEKYLSGQRENPLYEKLVDVDHLMAQKLIDKPKMSNRELEEFKRTVNLWGNLVPMGPKQNRSKGNKKVKVIYESLKKEFRFETTIHWKTKMDKKRIKDWTPAGIDERCDEIAKWAVKRWPSDLNDFRRSISLSKKKRRR